MLALGRREIKKSTRVDTLPQLPSFFLLHTMLKEMYSLCEVDWLAVVEGRLEEVCKLPSLHRSVSLFFREQ